MMVAMGIYDKLIHAITHLRKEFKESVRFMFPIFVGIAVAIIVAARILEFCFAMFPIQTNLLFCGLIAGSVPFIFTHVKGKAVKPGMMAAFLVFFLIVIAMALMGETEGAAADVSFSLLNVIKLLAVGIIAAATMVVPGVSGSMMLMVLGYYNTILESINDFVEAALSLDMPVLIENLLILVPFGVGVVIGIFLIAKIIEFIFQGRDPCLLGDPGTDPGFAGGDPAEDGLERFLCCRCCNRSGHLCHRMVYRLKAWG